MQTGQEIHISLIAAMIRHLARRGIGWEPLVEGLGFTHEDLRVRKRRISWEAFMDFQDRAQQALGGDWAFEQFVADFTSTTPILHLFARSVLKPESLYALGIERIGRKVYSHLGLRLERIGGGCLRLEVAIPEPYRPW